MNKVEIENYVSVLGGCNIDIIGLPHSTLIRGDSNLGSVELTLGGVGRNIAENIGLLGLPIKMFSVVGEDIYGDKLISETTVSGVDMSFVKVVAGVNTGTYLAILDENKDMDVAINDMDIIEYLNRDYIFENYKTIKNSSIIVFDTNPGGEILTYATELFGDKKLFLDTVSNIKAKKAKSIIGRFHTIKPNLKEAEVLTGITINSYDDMKNACAILHKKGVHNICISLSERGVFYSSKDGFGVMDTLNKKPKNVTGAGDAFQAGLVYGEYNGLKFKDTVRLAMAAASMAMDTPQTINRDIRIEDIIKLSKKVEEIKI
ncbi:MAG: carbohydrate kinase family protein [Gudongella sp.]|nr:carbohydrate kinase family protein [Gudongella sp.]